MQQTIQQEVSISGIGLFTGEKATLRLIPAEEGAGIVFRRTDLKFAPIVPAHLSFVKDAVRCTRLVNEQASVHMVEHLLSAVRAFDIDNVRIELDGPEIPAGDGSAKLFVDLIEKAGIKKQKAPRKVLKIEKPVHWSEGGVHLVALPADEFRISYTMHYPQSSLLGSQYYTIAVTP